MSVTVIDAPREGRTLFPRSRAGAVDEGATEVLEEVAEHLSQTARYLRTARVEAAEAPEVRTRIADAEKELDEATRRVAWLLGTSGTTRGSNEVARAELLDATLALRAAQAPLREFRLVHSVGKLTTIELAEYERLVASRDQAEHRQKLAKRGRGQ